MLFPDIPGAEEQEEVSSLTTSQIVLGSDYRHWRPATTTFATNSIVWSRHCYHHIAASNTSAHVTHNCTWSRSHLCSLHSCQHIRRRQILCPQDTTTAFAADSTSSRGTATTTLQPAAAPLVSITATIGVSCISVQGTLTTTFAAGKTSAHSTATTALAAGSISAHSTLPPHSRSVPSLLTMLLSQYSRPITFLLSAQLPPHSRPVVPVIPTQPPPHLRPVAALRTALLLPHSQPIASGVRALKLPRSWPITCVVDAPWGSPTETRRNLTWGD